MVDHLRKRRDFLAAAKARRAGTASFLMQGRDRGDAGAARVGFTVTKKTGTAVVRNRIRRRLREAVRKVLPEAGRAGFDYVLVAREAALRTPFEGLVREVERAVRKLHAPAEARKDAGPKDAGPKDAGPKPRRAPAARDAGGTPRAGGPQGPAPDNAAGRSPPAASICLSDDMTPTPADGGPRHE